jgi:hypothetical protein
MGKGPKKPEAYPEACKAICYRMKNHRKELWFNVPEKVWFTNITPASPFACCITECS